MLEFKSEYEFVTGKSTLNGSVVILEKGANIVDKMVEECKQTYSKQPLICFLEKED